MDWLLKETKGRLEQGDQAYAHYAKAYEFYDQDKKDQALHEYKLAAQANPRFVNAHVWIARIHMEQGQYGRAVEEWNTVLQLEPSNKRAAWFRDQARRRLSGR